MCLQVLIVRAFTLLLASASGLACAQIAPPPAVPDRLHAIELLANTGRGEEALGQLDGLAASEPNTPGTQRVRGKALYSLNRLPDAEKAFAAAMVADPLDQEAAQMRGLTLFRLGRPADAIPFLENAHEAGVQSKADPSYVLALCYVDSRRYDDARNAFAAQYSFPSDSAQAYLLAARMLLRREYVPVAERFARQAVQIDNHLPLAHEVLGEIALAQNKLDDAFEQFNLELKINPMDPASYERLGDLLGRQGKFAASREALQRAVLLEPNATGPYILLGKTTLGEGDAVAALTYLQRADRMDPANAMTHTLLARAYRTLNRPEDAARELKVVEKLHAVEAPKLITPE